jgi:hypothetical protein
VSLRPISVREDKMQETVEYYEELIEESEEEDDDEFDEDNEN